MRDFPLFNKYILDMIHVFYPDTTIWQIQGTTQYDLTFELREQGKKLQYKPWELYTTNNNEGDAIESLFISWNNIKEAS